MNQSKFNRMALPRRVRTTQKWRKRFGMMIALPPAVMAVLVLSVASMAKDAAPGVIIGGALFTFCFFLLFFVAFAAQGDYLLPVRLFRSGSMAQGRVTERLGAKNLHVNVAFSDDYGKNHTAKIRLGILEDRYNVGDNVEVIFDATSPWIAIIPREDYFEVSDGQAS